MLLESDTGRHLGDSDYRVLSPTPTQNNSCYVHTSLLYSQDIRKCCVSLPISRLSNDFLYGCLSLMSWNIELAVQNPRHFNLRCSARSLSSTPKHHLKELLIKYPREITIVNYISADEEFNKVLTKEVETKHATSTSLSCVQVSRIADFLSSFHYFMNYI